jgi:hypothetical protein
LLGVVSVNKRRELIFRRILRTSHIPPSTLFTSSSPSSSDSGPFRNPDLGWGKCRNRGNVLWVTIRQLHIPYWKNTPLVPISEAPEKHIDPIKLSDYSEYISKCLLQTERQLLERLEQVASDLKIWRAFRSKSKRHLASDASATIRQVMGGFSVRAKMPLYSRVPDRSKVRWTPTHPHKVSFSAVHSCFCS